ncbi:MAG: YhcH/YjgK/YiaL family protein [Kiritimatiellae bacterium]|nr:YhcH/YjgK/YiaL family protein [Kiritimatiellia bacterium]
MILDHLAHAASYYVLSPRIEKALRFLSGQDLGKLPDGRIEIDGEDLYASVSGYETKAGLAGGVWEAHRRYVDVQCLIAGVEKIGYADISSLKVAQAYDEGKDCELLNGRGQFFKLRPRHFVVFFPQDGHMPSRAAGRPAPVRKVVVKIKI